MSLDHHPLSSTSRKVPIDAFSSIGHWFARIEAMPAWRITAPPMAA